MTEADQIAAFLAKRGAKRVPAGVGTVTERQMFYAVRGEKPRAADPISERRVVYDHLGRERVVNGLGEWVA